MSTAQDLHDLYITHIHQMARMGNHIFDAPPPKDIRSMAIQVWKRDMPRWATWKEAPTFALPIDYLIMYHLDTFVFSTHDILTQPPPTGLELPDDFNLEETLARSSLKILQKMIKDPSVEYVIVGESAQHKKSVTIDQLILPFIQHQVSFVGAPGGNAIADPAPTLTQMVFFLQAVYLKRPHKFMEVADALQKLNIQYLGKRCPIIDILCQVYAALKSCAAFDVHMINRLAL